MDGGFDSLLNTLAQLGADGLALPGLDEPMQPATYVRVILAGGRDEGWDFDRAWAAAINRLQPAVSDGAISIAAARRLREERTALESERGIFRAAYEGRRRTAAEHAESIAGTWRRESALDRHPR